MPRFRRSHKAPAESGSHLIDPPVDAIEPLIDNNRLLRAAFDTRVGDLKLWELIAATRREMLVVSAEYTSSYHDVLQPSDMADWIRRPILMGGHQPDLFHPGVWLKNFVLDAYAQAVGGTAINLVVDTDRCTRWSVGVPVGNAEEAHLETVELDAPCGEMAWEERAIIDHDRFASFGERVASLLAPIVPNPIIRSWWPQVVERAAASHRLGLAIAQARHGLEREWGLDTLELPVSELVRLPTVMVLSGWLLSQTRRLHEIYNEALATFRREHRTRGRGRPMPDLATRPGREDEGTWFEIPWWLWSKEDPRRRRVFAHTNTAGNLLLSDMETLRVELPISPDTSPAKWVDALSRLDEHDVRLRPRAIMTTLIARLLVADVFVHGIGGAVYDEITDAVVVGLTGCEPPRHAVVSGTLLLPTDMSGDPDADIASIHRQLRDIEFHPERYLGAVSADGAARSLAQEKWRWIETPPTRALAKRRCQAIRSANDSLAGYTQPLRKKLLDQVGPLARASRAQSVLGSREYPWCFFSEDSLRRFLLLESS
jgi:hypothetical protein